MMVLSRLREKRWALFVARAVDRYEAWWKSRFRLTLTEDDMGANTSFRERYLDFPTRSGARMNWSAAELPPLGKLSVLAPFDDSRN